MLRNVDLSEISDGKLYDANDMVKADCKGCEGCSACCRGMGQSIVLDPLDVHRLTTGLGVPFEALLSQHIELNVVDGLILPNLKMTESADACPFLNGQGRCSIHAYRPGICRLFPLGRFYENDSFRYFLQVHECPKPRSKSINGWIPMIYAPTNSSSVTGTISSKLSRNGLPKWRIRHRYVPSVCTYCSSSTSRLAKTSMKHSTEDLTKQSGTLRCKI